MDFQRLGGLAPPVQASRNGREAEAVFQFKNATPTASRRISPRRPAQAAVPTRLPARFSRTVPTARVDDGTTLVVCGSASQAPLERTRAGAVKTSESRAPVPDRAPWCTTHGRYAKQGCTWSPYLFELRITWAFYEAFPELLYCLVNTIRTSECKTESVPTLRPCGVERDTNFRIVNRKLVGNRALRFLCFCEIRRRTIGIDSFVFRFFVGLQIIERFRVELDG
mmetsp:Transcript_7420/g.32970  ORF Transcript_7420/g.32970 Transcript_7420/m.32970 type:complete len:224 (+) Transcript_7420:1766-2437(+)